MNLSISNREDLDSKNLILSNATFKKNDKLSLESPNEFSPQLILLA
jgi:hypothetical protein